MVQVSPRVGIDLSQHQIHKPFCSPQVASQKETHFLSFSFFWFFKAGFLCVALAILELTLDQAEFRDPPTSASLVLRSKMCASTS